MSLHSLTYDELVTLLRDLREYTVKIEGAYLGQAHVRTYLPRFDDEARGLKVRLDAVLGPYQPDV